MACALGAAAAAAGARNKRPKLGYTWRGGLREIFHELEDQVTHPITGRRMSLAGAVVASTTRQHIHARQSPTGSAV
jgi:hypothetical protein